MIIIIVDGDSLESKYRVLFVLRQRDSLQIFYTTLAHRETANPLLTIIVVVLS